MNLRYVQGKGMVDSKGVVVTQEGNMTAAEINVAY